MKWLTTGLLAVLVAVAGAAQAEPDWTASVILQPQYQWVYGRRPEFVWRRVRGVAGGRVADDLNAKIQVDWTNTAVRLLDGYLDYKPFRKPIEFGIRGGMQYPDWAHEGMTFPDTINYAYVVAATGLALRNAGGQAYLGFLDDYRVSVGVFNGDQNFNDRNDTWNTIGSFSTVQPHYDAKAWYLIGKDPAIGGGEARTDLLGLEFTNIHVGRVGGEIAYIAGRRFGRRVQGAYTQASYRLTDRDIVFCRFDWADVDRNTPFSDRQRYTVSYHHRFKTWLDTLWDVEYDQRTNRFSAYARGDIRF